MSCEVSAAEEDTVKYHNPTRRMVEGRRIRATVLREGGAERGNELTALVSSLSLGEEPKYRPP